MFPAPSYLYQIHYVWYFVLSVSELSLGPEGVYVGRHSVFR